MTTDGQASACFYAFDMLHMGRDDLRPLELIGRRAMLRKLLRNAGPPLLFSEHMDSENGRPCSGTPAVWGWRASCRSVRRAATSPADAMRGGR
jgi:GH15 family glucan-1,4-alpha-glucosidase